MEFEQREKIVTQASALGLMYDKNQISVDLYGRWMLKLAYDFMVGDEAHLAAGIVADVPELYYNDYHAKDMVADEELARISIYLAKRFQMHGIAEATFTVNILPRIGIA